MSIMPECVAGYTERRIRIDLAAWRIPYFLANFIECQNRKRTGNAK